MMPPEIYRVSGFEKAALEIQSPSHYFSNDFSDSLPNLLEIQSAFHNFSSDFSDALHFDYYPVEELLLDTNCFDLEAILRYDSNSPIGGASMATTEEITYTSSSSQQFSEYHDHRSPGSSLRSESSTDPSPLLQQPLNIPVDDMEIDNELSLRHLMAAYGEAMAKGQSKLMEVIAECGADRADSLGKPIERLAFNLFCRDRDSEYAFIVDESRKNFHAAFSVFYQIFPLARFAHFAANKAILESIPRCAEALRVVDFGRDEIQWAPLIEAISRRGIRLRLTLIKWDKEEKNLEIAGNNFSRSLLEYAKDIGAELMVEEMEIDELLSEVDQMRRDSREWTVFNCIVGLPNMERSRRRRRRRRRRDHVEKFLSAAQQIITNSGNGIITFSGDVVEEKSKLCSGFGEFFEVCLGHYQTLYELIDAELPLELTEAKLAMESLFISPSISSSNWVRKWEETRVGLGRRVDMEGVRISRENLAEAMELVMRGNSCYGVRVAEENQMVLEWKGAPLVRFTTWGRHR